MAEINLSMEIEHELNKALFKDETIKNALASIGITQEMAANKRGLFTDADVVAEMQSRPDSDPLKAQLLGKDSILSINRHKGNAPGGNQFGKLRFLEEVYGDLVRRLNENATLPDGSPNPDKISDAAFKYAAYDVFKFVDQLAQGKIEDAHGNVMSVMGNSDYAHDLLRRFYGSIPGITVTGALSPLLTRVSATVGHVVMARHITGITHLSP